MSDNSLLIDAIGYIDDAYLEKYFEMKEDVVCKKKKNRMCAIDVSENTNGGISRQKNNVYGGSSMKKVIFIVSIIVAALVLTVSSFAVLKATGVFDYRSFFGLLKNDRIAATVNGENIYQGIVDAKKESYKTLSIMLNDETLDIPEEAEADFRKKSNMTESDILNEIIRHYVEKQEAKRLNLDVDENALRESAEKEFLNTKEYINSAKEDAIAQSYTIYMETMNMTEEEYIKEMGDAFIFDAYRNALREAYDGDNYEAYLDELVSKQDIVIY